MTSEAETAKNIGETNHNKLVDLKNTQYTIYLTSHWSFAVLFYEWGTILIGLCMHWNVHLHIPAYSATLFH